VDAIADNNDSGSTSSAGAVAPGTVENGESMLPDEELTIDGDTKTSALKKKKKKRSSVEDTGEVLRMADIRSPKTASNGEERRLAHDPGGGIEQVGALLSPISS